MSAQGTPVDAPVETGGIGLSQEDFEAIYGEATPFGDLLAYPNTFLDDSRLFVDVVKGRAAFIEISVPESSGLSPDGASSLTQKVVPEDAAKLVGWSIPARDANPMGFGLIEYDAPSMSTAGFGSTRIQTDASTGEVIRITISLAIPNGADSGRSTAGSVRSAVLGE